MLRWTTSAECLKRCWMVGSTRLRRSTTAFVESAVIVSVVSSEGVRLLRRCLAPSREAAGGITETIMKERTRAERRHHNRRLWKKRYKQEVRWNRFLYRDDHEDELKRCRLRAKVRLDTNVSCSCMMCGNPRRTWGLATWNAFTMQEHRADDALRDGMQEVEENA